MATSEFENFFRIIFTSISITEVMDCIIIEGIPTAYMFLTVAKENFTFLKEICTSCFLRKSMSNASIIEAI